MVFLALAILVFIGGIIWKCLEEEWWPIVVATIITVILIVASCVAIVPTGYTGILTTFGKVEEKTIQSGINFVAPWQRVITMDNRTQKVHIDTSAFSSDIQQVDLKLAVNYCIDQNTAQTLYKTVGINYYDNIMFPRIQENTKAVIAKYTAENLISKRETLSDQIHENTATDMRTYGITIVSISIEDIDFTDAFTDAVEAKQVAAQNKLAEQTRQEQQTMQERAAAERAVISANAEAEKAVRGEGFAPFERAVRGCLNVYMEKAKYAGFGENVLIRYLYLIEEQST